MDFSVGNANTPFLPHLSIGTGSSATLDDFTPADLLILRELLPYVKNSLLEARLSDLCWLRMTPRSNQLAKQAIKAYTAFDLTPEFWLADGSNCFERAIILCGQNKRSSVAELSAIVQSMITCFESTLANNHCISADIANTLLKAAPDEIKALKIAEALLNKGLELVPEKLHQDARSLFELALKFFERAKNTDRRDEVIILIAEQHEFEGEAELNDERAVPFFANQRFEDAIQTYRKLSKQSRLKYGVEFKIDDLRSKLINTGLLAVLGMQTVVPKPINIADLVAHARDCVRGKDKLKALAAIADIFGGVSYSTTKLHTAKRASEFPLSGLFRPIKHNALGQVIARGPARGLDNSSYDQDDKSINFEMIRSFVFEIDLVAQGQIYPAVEVLKSEHRISLPDILRIVSASPIVPADRHVLISKALFYGFENDFDLAIHILAPQIENIVRQQLKRVDVLTTTFDVAGIEQEIGLSSLMDKEKVDDIFGIDVAFEIRALFCNAWGPNLRNQIAHGLLSDDEAQSTVAIYAWWWSFRLFFKQYEYFAARNAV